MKVLMINVTCGIRSTGRICTNLAVALEEQGHEVKIAYGRENVPEQFQKYAVRIGTDLDVRLHGLRARLIDGCGFGSKKATERFIEWMKQWNPDVIHLHNIHGYYINVKVLFNYLKSCDKKIIWTLHDCWAFTGHCAYFDYVGCDKWKRDCKGCSQKKEYPNCQGFSRTQSNYVNKKVLFTGISNLAIVTPSEWLRNLARQSFLGKYNIEVINNGIDTNMFRPTPTDIKYRYGLNDKKIVLGVAAVWDRRKGLEYMVELAEKLDASYQVVIIGVTKKQQESLPSNIVGVLRTSSIQELVEWYSVAEVYVNPTLEDNYPTTNIEAIACGTPVITYNTGGSPESVGTDCGFIINKGDLDSIRNAIYDIKSKKSFLQSCKNRTIDFDRQVTSRRYCELYHSIVRG